MTIHEALMVLAACKPELDDCGDCPLYAGVLIEDEDCQPRICRPCEVIGKLSVSLALRQFPGTLEAPHDQG